ncbi:hydantoinase B/oxoprolinase family protein [Actinoplanes sp. NPDC051851]|uniref:hydantoinase B/oxoprolinase family protein n=1 Tax=Actinoplanes sp. NPDC051851 TaxID=3154753 RepID=UPI0034495131
MSATIDIVKAEITRNALGSAAEEMHDTLVRSAYNPLIFDVKDFGVAICSADGKLWAEAPGLPVFLGTLPATVRTINDKWGPDGLRDGDVIICNDPYLTGTHLSDVAISLPVFHRGRLVAFTTCMAHWADIGSASAGGWSTASTEIFQEGLRFTNQRIFLAGEANRDLLDLIEANVRVPETVLGDLHAQVATCRTGAERVRSICERYGADTVVELMDHVIASTERSLRAAITALPDGVYHRAARLDFDGVDRDYEPVISTHVTVAGDRLSVSFTGTSGQAPGPINIGRPAVLSSVATAVKGILDPLGRTNDAHMLISDIEWPAEPTIVTPEEPAPCDSYGYANVTITELVAYVLGRLTPDRGRASSYQMWAQYFLCTNAPAERRFVLAEPVQGGHGAFPGHDGATLVYMGDGDTWNTPVELLEARYPLICEQFSLNAGSAGAGEFRGGMGVRRDFRVLQENSMIKTALESTKDPLSLGLAGGGTGRASHGEITYPDGHVDVHHERLGDYPVPVGAVVGVRTGGGGGYGRPFDRDPERVAADVRDELVTPLEAREVYGVALLPGRLRDAWLVDHEETARLRGRE